MVRRGLQLLGHAVGRRCPTSPSIFLPKAARLAFRAPLSILRTVVQRSGGKMAMFGPGSLLLIPLLRLPIGRLPERTCLVCARHTCYLGCKTTSTDVNHRLHTHLQSRHSNPSDRTEPIQSTAAATNRQCPIVFRLCFDVPCIAVLKWSSHRRRVNLLICSHSCSAGTAQGPLD